MKTERIEKIISRFLLSPSYKVYRHILLVSALIIISLDMIINHPKGSHDIGVILLEASQYSIILIVSIYINIYIGIPYLLLRNRLFLYFLFVAIQTTLTLTIIAIIQMYMFDVKDVLQTITMLFMIVNVSSSIVVFCMIFAGVTTLILFKRWTISSQRNDELKSATLQSELQYLKNQINPHFLFNVLNNANVLLKEKKGGASSMLYKLKDILHYQTHGSTKDEIILKSDIQFLNDYLNLEKARRDRFEFSIHTNGDIENVELPPFLFIPFVENAVKHSQDSELKSYIHIIFTADDDNLQFLCVNSKPEDDEDTIRRVGGLGLRNIKRRLDLLYPECHNLLIKEEKTTYTVNLQLNRYGLHNRRR